MRINGVQKRQIFTFSFPLAFGTGSVCVQAFVMKYGATAITLKPLEIQIYQYFPEQWKMSQKLPDM